MRNTGLEEAQTGIKIARRNINNLRYADDTTRMAESGEAHGDLTSLAPHERLPESLIVPREKTPTGAAARGNP